MICKRCNSHYDHDREPKGYCLHCCIALALDEAWEEAEREADEDIRLGRGETFNSVKKLIEELHQEDS